VPQAAAKGKRGSGKAAKDNVVKLVSAEKGQPRTISSADELMNLWAGYIDSIVNDDYKVYPTKSGFAKFIGCNYTTVYHSIYDYYNGTKKDFDGLLADTLANGVNAGMYNVTMTIFCLKNWCSWADKQEQTNVDGGKSEKLIDKEEAAEKLKEYAKKIV